jgi:hypothetical protein
MLAFFVASPRPIGGESCKEGRGIIDNIHDMSYSLIRDLNKSFTSRRRICYEQD